MKCISLWQPWATAIALGFKQYETRSWRPEYRGPIAIHAAKHLDSDIAALCAREPEFQRLIDKAGCGYRQLPRGVIVCIADLKFCARVEGLKLTEQEREPDPSPRRARFI